MQVTEQEVIKRIKNIHGNKIKLISGFKSNTEKATFKCDEGHTWDSVVYSVASKGTGCRFCNMGKKNQNVDVFDSKLPAHVTRIGPYNGIINPVKMKCDKHGKYEAITGSCAIRKLGGCPQCSLENAKTAHKSKTHEQYLKQVRVGTRDTIKVLGTYVNANTQIDHQCSCGRTWKVAPKSMLQNFGTCKECVIRRLEEGKINNKAFFYYSKEIDGKKFRVQGYEGEALVFLKNRGIDLDKIVTHSSYIPKFRYEYKTKSLQYFPDFYYEPTKTIYEVKSTWTLGIRRIEQYIKVKKKAKAVIAEGYNFRLILGGLDRLPVIVLPSNWLDMKHKEFFSWLKECYGVSETNSKGRTY